VACFFDSGIEIVESLPSLSRLAFQNADASSFDISLYDIFDFLIATANYRSDSTINHYFIPP